MHVIVMKELREHIRLLPIGLLVIGGCIWSATPISLRMVGNLGSKSSELMTTSSLSAGFFAILLGAAQSWFDLGQRQRGFLFHRPFSRNQIMYGKMIAAAILYAIACLVPITLVSLWFAYCGPSYLPVRPAQLLPALLMCTLCFALHPVTMFTVEREARWIGTRLFPLVGTVFALFVCTRVAISIREAWYPFAVLIVFAFAAFASLTLVANHSSRNWIIGIGAFMLVVCCTGFLTSLMESVLFDPADLEDNPTFAMDETGNLWSYRFKRYGSSNGYQVLQSAVSGEQLRPNRKPDIDLPLPEGFSPRNLTYFNDITRNLNFDPFINPTRNRSAHTMFSDSRGSILIYDYTQHPALKGAITKSGFRSGEAYGEMFRNAPVMLIFPDSSSLCTTGINISDWLLADMDGIYQFNRQSATVDLLVELPIQKAEILVNSIESGYFLLVQSGENLHLYALENASGANDWFKSGSAADVENGSERITNGFVPKLTARKLHTYPKLPPELAATSPFIGLAKDGRLVTANQDHFGSVANEVDAKWDVSPYISPIKQYERPFAVNCTIACFPLGLFLFVYIAIVVEEIANGQAPSGLYALQGFPRGESMAIFFAVAILVTVTSVGMAIYVCRRRGLSLSSTIGWSIASLFLGLAGPLALVALNAKLAFELCSRCNRPRRIDREKCEHCACQWEPLPVEGIEIVDRSPSLARV